MEKLEQWRKRRCPPSELLSPSVVRRKKLKGMQTIWLGQKSLESSEAL